MAIASFLNKEVLAFREQGVRLEGISSFVLANAIEFSEKNSLYERVMAKVKERGWCPEWRDELSIERSDEDKDMNVFDQKEKKNADYFHVKVRNRHKSKIARNCVAFVAKVREPDGSVRSRDLVELKWKGVKSAGVSIPPGQFRHLDAFHVYRDSLSVANLGINPFIVDFSSYGEMYRLTGPGKFELDIVVYSDTFGSVSRTYILNIGESLDEINLKEKQ